MMRPRYCEVCEGPMLFVSGCWIADGYTVFRMCFDPRCEYYGVAIGETIVRDVFDISNILGGACAKQGHDC